MDPTALGRYLRETREAKEKTLEDAVSALKIRRPILESFEQGEFAVSESQVQIRGMLRNYARFLGLEEERILEYYAATQNNIRQRRRFGRVVEEEPQLQAPRKITDTQPKPPTLLDPPPNRFAWIGGALRNLALALVSVAAVAVIVFVIVDTLNLDEGTQGDGVAQAALQTASAQPPGTSTATYTPTWTPAPEEASATTDFSIAGIGGVQVQLTMTQRSFMRVTVDGVEEFSGIMEPGDEATYEGSNEIEVTVASAPAVMITFNGIEQEPFGVRGQEALWVFTPSSVEIMTGDGATLTPTASATATPTQPLPTAEITAEPETTQEISSSSAAQATVAETDGAALPTLTSIFENSPMPSATSADAQAPVAIQPATTDGAETTSEPEVEASAASAEPTSIPATATATQTATPAAPLPLRATSETTAPTKPPP